MRGPDAEVTPAQCRAARAMLDFSQGKLAEVAGVSRPVLVRFERGKGEPMPQNLAAIRRALEERGIVLVPTNGDGPGVRLKERSGA